MDLRDLRGDLPEWLLDLSFTDATFHFARRELDVDGIRYKTGLDWPEEVDDGIDPFGASPSAKRIDLTVWIPPELDLPALIEQGLDVSSMTGVLRRWLPTSNTSEIVVAGAVRGLEYGSVDEPLTFTLEEVEEDDAGRFPPVSARVTETTWPNAGSSALGEWYPWVIGGPGAGLWYVAPALFVDTATDRLLVAGHPVQAGSVGIINDDDGTSATLAVIHARDGAGRMVALVDLTASGVTIDPEGTYFVAWGVSGGCGLTAEDGSAIVGAGDVLAWILGFSRLRLDRGRLAAAAPALNAFRIDTVISTDPGSRFAPWDWIADHLLPILPLSMRVTDDGLAPVLWRVTGSPEEAVARIEVPAAGGRQPRAVRRGPVSYSERGEVANTLTLSYGHDPRTDTYTARLTLTGDPDVVAVDEDAVFDFVCSASRGRYRDADGQPLTLVREETSEALWDDATVAAVLRLWALRYAVQARLVGYSVDRDVAGHVQPGDLVLVIDDDLCWTDRLFVVEQITLSTSALVDLDLRAVEDPALNRHRSGNA